MLYGSMKVTKEALYVSKTITKALLISLRLKVLECLLYGVFYCPSRCTAVNKMFARLQNVHPAVTLFSHVLLN